MSAVLPRSVNSPRAALPARALRFAIPAAVLAVLFKLALSDGGRHADSLALAQIVVFLLLVALTGAHVTRATPVSRPLMAVLVVVAATTVTSVSPEASIRELLLWMMYAGIAMVVASTTAGAEVLFADGLVVIAGWLSLVALFIFWGANDPGMRWYSTFYWPNPFAGFLLLALPLTLVRFLRAVQVREALVHGLMALLLAVSLVGTYSRGAWLAFGAVMPLLFIVLRPPRWRTVLIRLVGLAALTVVAVVVLTQGAPVKDTGQGIAARATSVVSAEDYSVQGRLRFWQAGLAIFRDYPLLGTGPGTFGTVHTAYQRDVRYYAQNVHSLYVQMLADTGAVGFIAIVFLLAVVGAAWWRALRRARGSEEYGVIVGVGVSLAAFFLHSGVEMNWMFPANPAMAFAMIGVLAAYDAGATPWTRRSSARAKSSVQTVTLTLLLLAATAATTALWMGQRHFVLGQEAIRGGNFGLAETHYAEALRWNPLSSRYLDASAGSMAQGPQPKYAAASDRLRAAMAADRMNAAFPLHLARVLMSNTAASRAEQDEAEALLRRSLDLDRFNRPDAYRALAGLYRRQGRLDQATRVYDDAMALYRGGSLGSGSVLYLALWPGVVDLFRDAADLGASQGRLDRAAQILEALLEEDPQAVGAILQLSDLYIRLDRRDDARSLLEASASRMPDAPAIADALKALR